MASESLGGRNKRRQDLIRTLDRFLNTSEIPTITTKCGRDTWRTTVLGRLFQWPSTRTPAPSLPRNANKDFQTPGRSAYVRENPSGTPGSSTNTRACDLTIPLCSWPSTLHDLREDSRANREALATQANALTRSPNMHDLKFLDDRVQDITEKAELFEAIAPYHPSEAIKFFSI
ncbi:calcium-binding precursor cnx1 [Fusarium acutatum]|uniref:Calcium-binding cnx1 n=1 Tax=Fusarium acutatum TaxID=78861 RepID=A0A8H4JSQ7_9HYPO|nr:calcium-binding precursor cnx1 [Fusarium acutatum]